MCFGNLRGLKEAGPAFAVPTSCSRRCHPDDRRRGDPRGARDLPKYKPHTLPGAYPIGPARGPAHRGMIFMLLRAFANGGASLTGIEAVSDAVGAFRPPEGRNARRVLMTEGAILGILVAGISWLAHATHATPRKAGYPTVLAQEAQPFGDTVVGRPCSSWSRARRCSSSTPAATPASTASRS